MDACRKKLRTLSLAAVCPREAPMRLRSLGGLMLALVVSRVAGAEPAVARPRLTQDARLSARVTLFRERILLGDLLLRLGKETGAEIRCNPDDPGQGSLELTVGSPGVAAW